MPAYRDEKKGNWYAAFYYEDWNGAHKKKLKRGFPTKKAAIEWERQFQLQKNGSVDMKFESFVNIYCNDLKNRVREHTWSTKEYVIYHKILPFFRDMKLCDIKPRDVIAWQNELMKQKNKKGQALSSTYINKIHGQLSSIFNYAVRYYGLESNPARIAGCAANEKRKEIIVWTKDEYMKFAEVMMEQPLYYYAFEMLYWCGIREGELLALTPEDFNFKKNTVSITKSYQRLNGKDVITDPKTKKSIRVVSMPAFLAEEMKEYMDSLYGVSLKDRIFPVTKSGLSKKMEWGSKAAGIPRIRIHDLRHSHISLLISMGFSAVEIADRVGHESIHITYQYAHMFPERQKEMVDRLEKTRMEDQHVS